MWPIGELVATDTGQNSNSLYKCLRSSYEILLDVTQSSFLATREIKKKTEEKQEKIKQETIRRIQKVRRQMWHRISVKYRKDSPELRAGDQKVTEDDRTKGSN